MPSPQDLKAQINSVQGLQSVVKTMKALAAVSIRQYERAVESLVDYDRTVELGLQIVLKHRYFDPNAIGLPAIANQDLTGMQTGIVVFGSDQGLCGQFNEQIAEYAIAQLRELEIDPDNIWLAAIGARLLPALQASKLPITEKFSLPTSATSITASVQDLLVTLEQWRSEADLRQIILFHNRPTSGASYQPRTVKLLPMDPDWLRQLQLRPWETSVFPTFTMDWQPLFDALVREYLFVALHRAFAESLASENASRLASMQAAEKNIDENLSDLNSQYRRERQSAITSELLDIVSGFEALK
jgi:F-type H+-transporting ATPase subunit gamma